MDVYVGNLNKEIRKDSLEKLFSVFGPILNAYIVYDNNNESKGYGFVTMENATHAGRAIDELNGILVGGQNIVVREANKQDHNENSQDKIKNIKQDEPEKQTSKVVDETKYSINKVDNGLITVKFSNT